MRIHFNQKTSVGTLIFHILYRNQKDKKYIRGIAINIEDQLNTSCSNELAKRCDNIGKKETYIICKLNIIKLLTLKIYVNTNFEVSADRINTGLHFDQITIFDKNIEEKCDVINTDDTRIVIPVTTAVPITKPTTRTTTPTPKLTTTAVHTTKPITRTTTPTTTVPTLKLTTTTVPTTKPTTRTTTTTPKRTTTAVPTTKPITRTTTPTPTPKRTTTTVPTTKPTTRTTTTAPTPRITTTAVTTTKPTPSGTIPAPITIPATIPTIITTLPTLMTTHKIIPTTTSTRKELLLTDINYLTRYGTTLETHKAENSTQNLITLQGHYNIYITIILYII